MGFEPTGRFWRPLVFETSALSRSATLPKRYSISTQPAIKRFEQLLQTIEASCKPNSVEDVLAEHAFVF